MTTHRVNNEAVLRVLRAGTHTASEIAAELCTTAFVAQHFVDMLFYSGKIRIDRRVRHDVAYELAPAAVARVPLDTPSAGPRLAPNLQSTLAGYDREISRRVELAMTTRAR
ncbi:DNA-binding protein [Burkholderia stabilis]